MSRQCNHKWVEDAVWNEVYNPDGEISHWDVFVTSECELCGETRNSRHEMSDEDYAYYHSQDDWDIEAAMRDADKTTDYGRNDPIHGDYE